MNPSKPWRITLDTNPDDCNLHCIICEEHSLYRILQGNRKRSVKPIRRMRPELIEKVLEEAKAMGVAEVIPSTMGEPLLFAHFEKIIGLCRHHNMMMNLTTNGTFPRLGAKEWGEKIIPVTSDVKISWNGATKETQEKIMSGSKWEKHLESARQFIEVRDNHARDTGRYCRITLQMTFLETNIHELSDIVRLAADLGADRVKGHHVWIHFKELRPLSLRRSAESVLRWNKAVEKARQVAENYRLPNGKRILLDNIYPLDPGQPKELIPDDECPFLGKEIWVSAEGRFNPCCAPDEERLILGEFGNLNDLSLSSIWNSCAYLNLMKDYSTYPLCKTCNMKRKRGQDDN